MTTNKIITQLDRNEFKNLIKSNEGLVIIKFTASWCGPCKTIAPFVEDQFLKTPEIVTCANIDVDDNFDIFAYMKSKKMVKGVPTILAYKKDNKSFAPDFSISGSKEDDLINFFKECVMYTKNLNTL
tara:strand:- start:4052 stop:4432 length:381 start_codon:yes stop_codon:yes gene_type:complete